MELNCLELRLFPPQFHAGYQTSPKSTLSIIFIGHMKHYKKTLDA